MCAGMFGLRVFRDRFSFCCVKMQQNDFPQFDRVGGDSLKPNKRRYFDHHGDKMTSWPAGLWPCCIFSLDVCCLLRLWRQRSTSVCLTDPAWTKKGPQQCSTELWEQTEFSGVYSWWTSAFIFVLVHIYQQYLHVGKKKHFWSRHHMIFRCDLPLNYCLMLCEFSLCTDAALRKTRVNV